MSTLHPNLDAITDKIAKQQDIIDPIIEHQYKTNKGDGYVGIINAIDIRGKNKTLNLIVKCAPTAENLRKNMPIQEAFLNEIRFYEEIMSEFNKLQSEYNLKDKFVSIPTCYATVNSAPNEMLLLENIKSQGYELRDRKKAMNLDHVEFVFREYGKLHALSYALKEKKPEVFERLTVGKCNVLLIFMNTAVDLYTKTAQELLTLIDPVEDKELADLYGEFANNIFQKYKSVIEADEYAVVIHGDCWCNNMMFKYNGDSTQTPSSMRLLDFQISMTASPVLDLAYFLYTCGSEEALNNLQRIQNSYYDSLSTHLQQFSLDAERVYPKTVFLNHWKKYSKFGLVMATVGLKVMTSDSDESPDFGEYIEKNETGNVAQSMNFVSRNHQEYRRRAKIVIQHFYENKLF